MDHALQHLLAWWSTCSWLEVLGCVSGLACVWLYGKENIWAWPAGIVQTLCFLVVVYGAQLYSDVVLQIVFLILSITGWYEWLHGGPQKTELRIAPTIPLARRVVLLALTLAVNLGAAWYFARHTQAAAFFWDATILAFSLLAQWLLNKKVLGNWLFWIAVNVLSIYVYAGRKLYLMAVLYAIFLVLATKGYLAWKQLVRKSAQAPAPGTPAAEPAQMPEAAATPT